MKKHDWSFRVTSLFLGYEVGVLAEGQSSARKKKKIHSACMYLRISNKIGNILSIFLGN